MPAFRSKVAESIRQHMTVVDEGSLVHVGHKLGAYMDYPHRICADGEAGGVVPLEKLVDRAVAEPSGLDGLELDLQPAPEPDGTGDLFVVHDPLPPEVPLARYKEMSLRTLLLHLRKTGFASGSKRLFMELKAQRTCGGSLATSYGESLIARKLLDILKDFDDIAPHVSLTSFNARALEVAHELQTERHLKGLRYYLIVGTTNPILGRLVCWIGSGDVPSFDTDQKVLWQPWLTGIWFSPTTLKNYAKKLNEINDRRDEINPRPARLRFMFSVYLADWEDISDTFGPKESGLRNVEGVIYDVCDEAGKCPTEVEDKGDCSHHSV